MPLFNHILFPVDFSGRSAAMLPMVESIARKFEAKLTLLHVLQIPAAWYGGADAGVSYMIDIPALIVDARRQLESFGPPSSAKVEKTVQEGDPGCRIVAYATEHGVDLIMMPTHGYGRFRSLLLGSTAAKVLHDAHCAVWTSAHTREEARRVRPGEIRTILCALDERAKPVGLLEKSAEVAEAFVSSLIALHAVPAATLVSKGRQDVVDLLWDSAWRYWTRIVSEAKVPAEVMVSSGEVSTVVREAALERHADLIVIGRGALNRPLGGLRTHTYAIIRDAPCSVLSL